MTDIPFEVQVLQRLRMTRRRNADAQQQGYMGPGGDVLPVLGDDIAPYHHALGRASTTGSITDGVVTTGDAQRVLVDEHGRLWTRDGTLLGAGTTALASVYHSAAVDDAEVVRAGATRLIAVRGIVNTGYNTDLFLQVHDLAAVPANPAEPVWELLVPAVSGYAEGGDGFEGLAGGLLLTTGLTLAWSTTPGVYTDPGDNPGFFEALYLAAA